MEKSLQIYSIVRKLQSSKINTVKNLSAWTLDKPGLGRYNSYQKTDEKEKYQSSRRSEIRMVKADQGDWEMDF